MTDPADITPQTPGATPQADNLAALVDGTVAELLAALPTLDEIELDQLEQLERAGPGRKTALGGIKAERDRRDAGDLPASDKGAPEDDPAPSVTGQPDYRHMRACDVDPRTITHNVLTRDGWVCPHPSAVPQG
jgi:hypothetical protein